MSESHEATLILSELRDGSTSAAGRLLPLVYTELRALAGSYFRRERSDHTLQPTAVVHEAFVRLIDQTGVTWKDRTHFFAVAATAMRQILTDHARRHNAIKRGGGQQRIDLDEAVAAGSPEDLDLVALDEALTRLAQLDPGGTVSWNCGSSADCPLRKSQRCWASPRRR